MNAPMNTGQKTVLALAALLIAGSLCHAPWQSRFAPSVNAIGLTTRANWKQVVDYGPVWSPPKWRNADEQALAWPILLAEWAVVAIMAGLLVAAFREKSAAARVNP